ncbi:MAG: Asp-tRNA(Asn)/Glu-tRNA(Gln) amidotransferase subunit GatC [Azospirillaceae bacterium]
MSLDKATVARIAHLARIRMPEEDLDSMATELSRILDWVEQLNAVPTDDVAPMTSVAPHTLRRRPDEVTDGRVQGKVLANAPEAVSGFFAVPKVVE